MYEFLSANAIYIVFFIILIIWLGIASYFFRVDRKLTRLEKMVEDHHSVKL